MDLWQSQGLVRRILSLSTLLGALLILLSGSTGSLWKALVDRERPEGPTACSLGRQPQVGSPQHPPPRKELNFQGRKDGLSFAPGETHAYFFDLEPDDFVDIDVDQQGVDVTATIKAPGGQPPVTVDRWNEDSGPENIPLLAAVAGRYEVDLTGGSRGTYQILVSPKRKATPRDFQNAAGALAYSRGTALRGGKRREAEREFRKALASWEASDYREGQADAAFELAGLFSDRKRDALPFLDQALTLYRDVGNRHQEAIILNDLGFAQDALGDKGKAFAYYNSALAITQEIEVPKTKADILFNRGRLYTRAGESENALRDLEEAVDIRRALRDDISLAEALNALGRVYYVQNELDKAWSLHHEAATILKQYPDRHREVSGETLVHLGDVHRRRGEFNRAISQYLQALKLLQDTGHPWEEATALNNLALAYFEVKSYHDALGAFQHCQKVFQALDDTEAVANAWTNMGWVLDAMNRNDEAFAAYDRALAMSGGKEHPFLEVAANYGQARSQWRRGNLPRAQSDLKKALAAMESVRTKAERADLRSSFLAGKQELYDLLVEILMEQHRRDPTKGYDRQAFEASETACSRHLLEDLEDRLLIPTVSVQDIQSQVLGSGDVVLLEYFLGDQRSYLWVVTASSFTRYELPASRAQVEKLAKEVHDLLEVSNKIEKLELAIRRATDLSRLLFGQVASRLEGKKLLIVAPPELQYVAFDVLPEDLRESARRGTAWPRPWIADHEITVEPSATVLETLRRRNKDKEPPSGLMGILADPVYSLYDERTGSKRVPSPTGKPTRFSRLQSSGKEVQSIETAIGKAGLGNARRLVALGFDANRQRVLAGDLKDFRYLHLSAHGDLDVTSSDRSAIVLSRRDREGRRIDGFLRAGEIAELELPADLVVLSACQTGLGRKIRGEGLVGLTQAFFTAGASRVMVSLWDVDDQATSLLMSRFYQKLLQDHLSPAAALKEAQVWMWQQPKWKAPRYWGGFVLQGEWK